MGFDAVDSAALSNGKVVGEETGSVAEIIDLGIMGLLEIVDLGVEGFVVKAVLVSLTVDCDGRLPIS